MNFYLLLVSPQKIHSTCNSYVRSWYICKRRRCKWRGFIVDLAQAAQLVGLLSRTPKVVGWSLLRVPAGGSPCSSLPPLSPSSKIIKHDLKWGLKRGFILNWSSLWIEYLRSFCLLNITIKKGLIVWCSQSLMSGSCLMPYPRATESGLGQEQVVCKFLTF